MSIETGTHHIAIVKGDSIESKTLPNGTLAVKWLLTNACPRGKEAANEFLDWIQEHIDALRRED